MTNRLAFAALAVLAACGDDPVSFSAPVGIELKAKSDDVMNGVITEDKGITTESGNPYGAFINDATARLGRAPGRVEIDGAIEGHHTTQRHAVEVDHLEPRLAGHEQS